MGFIGFPGSLSGRIVLKRYCWDLSHTLWLFVAVKNVMVPRFKESG